MAEDFLAKVEIYKKRTSDTVLKRRQRVLHWLNEVYKARRGRADEIVEDLSRHMGQPVKKTTVANDAAVYRYAFLYLTDPSLNKKIGQMLLDQPNMGALAGVRALKEAGIEKWEQLKTRQAEREIPIITDVSQVEVSVENMPAAKALAEASGQIQTLLPQLNKLFRVVESSAGKLAREESLMRDEVRALKDEIRRQEAAAKDLRQELDTLKDAIDQTHIEQLKRMAVMRPDRPEIERIAQKLESEQSESRKKLSAYETELPKSFDWKKDGTGTVVYEKSFLSALTRLSKEEISQAVSAVKKLCSNGPSYTALQSKRLQRENMPHTPNRSMYSRAASDLRFTWKREGSPSVLTIFWIYRRGETQTHQKES